MVAFPGQTFTKENVKIRFQEPFTSDALNKKHLAFPKGVYQGFDPDIVGNSVFLRIDSTEGYSLLRVKSGLGPHLLDIFTEEDVELDFTGHLPGDFPVWVVARANYQIGSPTTAEIFTQTSSGNGVDEINICQVDGPVGSLSVLTTVPSFRHEPTAYSGQDFGFMPGGSVEDLATAVALTTEVTDARTGIDLTVHPDLQTRLNTDLSGSSMAGRLARALDTIKGNVHTIPSASLPASTLNASASFGNLARTFFPASTFEGGGVLGVGGAGSDGALTAFPDNVVAILDPLNGGHFNDATTGRPVYGRVASPATIITSGTTEFTNASTTVTNNGTGDYIADGVVAGDIALGDDGNYYEVQGPVTMTTYQITPAYQGVGAFVAAATLRRWTVSFFISDGAASESAYSFPAGPDLDLQIYYHAAISLDQNRRHSMLDLIRSYTTPFAPDGGTNNNEAVQGSDTRLVNVCKTDGTTPFTAAQGGIDAVAATDLVTLSQLNAATFPPASYRGIVSGSAGTVIIYATGGISTGGVTHSGGTGITTVATAGTYFIMATHTGFGTTVTLESPPGAPIVTTSTGGGTGELTIQYILTLGGGGTFRIDSGGGISVGVGALTVWRIA